MADLWHLLTVSVVCFLGASVCAIVIPWNYPLMMLAWKSAACLAAGNTLVLKPAQVRTHTPAYVTTDSVIDVIPLYQQVNNLCYTAVTQLYLT